MKYKVKLIAQQALYTYVTVQADSAEAADELAVERARGGNVAWYDDYIDDESIEVFAVNEVTA